MKPEIKKIQPTKSNMDAYFANQNVIKKTARTSTINYGKIIAFTDLDKDG